MIIAVSSSATADRPSRQCRESCKLVLRAADAHLIKALRSADCFADFGSVSVTAVVLGGLPPGSVPAFPGDLLRIWPHARALLLTCPRVANIGPAHPVGLIRSLSAGWRDPSQMCRSVTPPRPVPTSGPNPWKEHEIVCRWWQRWSTPSSGSTPTATATRWRSRIRPEHQSR